MFSTADMREYRIATPDGEYAMLGHAKCGKAKQFTSEQIVVSDIMNAMVHHDFMGCEHDTEFV